MNIRFLEPARNEIDDAFDWYEMEQRGLGRRFLAEIQSALTIAPFTDLKARYRDVPWMLCLEPDSSNGIDQTICHRSFPGTLSFRDAPGS